MENENLPEVKVELKADLTEVANKAYEDGGKKFVKELGKAGATVVGLFNNTIGGAIEIYNTWARTKIENVKQNIQNNMLKIPPEKLITPPINIIGPAMEGLKYNLDENELKQMFENLISNSCNSDYSNIVHPRFAEIIKQLSKDDALLLKELSYKPCSAYPVANVINKTTSGFTTLFPNFYVSNSLDIKKVPAILNNLQTLGILEISYENFLTNDTLYDPITNSMFYQELAINNPQISYQKGLFALTIFGRNFINVCI